MEQIYTRGFSRTDEVNPRHRGAFFADLWKFIRELFANAKAYLILRTPSGTFKLDIILAQTFLEFVFKTFKAKWVNDLNRIGLQIAKAEDDVYVFVHKGQEIFRGTKSEAKEALEEAFKKSDIEEYFDNLSKIKHFKKITKAMMRTEMPTDFLKALKKLDKTEDEILEYYTNYHNENNYIFLNQLNEIIAKNANISKTDAFSLWSYTTNDYYWDLNNWLRNRIHADKTKEISRLITNALEKMPKYNGTAFRALEFKEDSLLFAFLEKHQKGNIVDYTDFVSCGSNTKAAFFNKHKKNVFLKLEVKNAPVISDFSDGVKIRGYSKEELLLLKNRKFEVINYKEVNGKHYLELIEK